MSRRFVPKQQTEIYKYHHGFEPDSEGKFPSSIIAKFDYYTAMYYDCTILDLLRFFNLDMYLTEDLYTCYEHRYRQVNNAGESLKVVLAPGISFEIHIQHIMQQLRLFDIKDVSFEDFCHTQWKAIRFALTGTGLEFLRSKGYEVESRLMMPSYMMDIDGKYYANAPDGTRCKITRIDVCFDLLNYCPSFYRDCVSLCQANETQTGRVFCGLNPNLKSPSVWSAKVGHDRTLYLGSSQSDKLSRTYDKMLQWNNSNKDVATFPYKTKDGVIPESWIRVELQLRDKFCDDLLFKCAGDFTKMLNWYYYHFAICKEKGVVCEEYAAVFDWQLISTIIQNANYVCDVPDTATIIERIKKRILKGYVALVALMGGVDSVSAALEYDFMMLQQSEDEIDQRRFSAYLRSCLDDSNNLGQGVFIDNKGLYRFVR